MRRLGRALHVTPRGNLIARADHVPPLGAPVVTRRRERVGVIVDVFGPADKPYVAIRDKSRHHLERFVGKELFIPPRRRRRRPPRRRRGRPRRRR
ncbi:H/ACA ribonucleoprotein complex subunit GAR1 [Methanopyrus kandleri]|uniref:RNA-binding protein involved in rRNA processing n=2 Tax=Methanopyrus kandleri TaxID=2320 RepID=Q8TX20_METKA|nr:RNA-binding protein involved in rRNA processing [Methanopyrus kandleri AV19]HII69913.1 H/ACA RNA-protein complex protein Gar1 [Methanopyrus kandleri]